MIIFNLSTIIKDVSDVNQQTEGGYLKGMADQNKKQLNKGNNCLIQGQW